MGDAFISPVMAPQVASVTLSLPLKLKLQQDQGGACGGGCPSPGTHGAQHMAVSKDCCKSIMDPGIFIPMINSSSLGTYPNQHAQDPQWYSRNTADASADADANK